MPGSTSTPMPAWVTMAARRAPGGQHVGQRVDGARRRRDVVGAVGQRHGDGDHEELPVETGRPVTCGDDLRDQRLGTLVGRRARDRRPRRRAARERRPAGPGSPAGSSPSSGPVRTGPHPLGQDRDLGVQPDHEPALGGGLADEPAVRGIEHRAPGGGDHRRASGRPARRRAPRPPRRGTPLSPDGLEQLGARCGPCGPRPSASLSKKGRPSRSASSRPTVVLPVPIIPTSTTWPG